MSLRWGTDLASTVLYVSMCVDWLWHLEFNLLVAVSGAYVTLFAITGASLLLFHT